jgi:hypothetical protein
LQRFEKIGSNLNIRSFFSTALSLPPVHAEVRMFGRRSHSRFTIDPASDGLLRILSDVVVQQSQDQELIAISREPGVVGDLVAVQIMTRHGVVRTSVRIAESRPVITDGAVRHRLRLVALHPLQPEL